MAGGPDGITVPHGGEFRAPPHEIGAVEFGCGRLFCRGAKSWFEYFAKIGEDGGLEPFTWMVSRANVAAGQRVPAGAIIGRGSKHDGRQTRCEAWRAAPSRMKVFGRCGHDGIKRFAEGICRPG